MSSNYIFGIVVYVAVAIFVFIFFATGIGAVLCLLGYAGYHMVASIPRAFRSIKDMFNTATGRER